MTEQPISVADHHNAPWLVVTKREDGEHYSPAWKLDDAEAMYRMAIGKPILRHLRGYWPAAVYRRMRNGNYEIMVAHS